MNKTPLYHWIKSQHTRLCTLLQDWSEINSSSDNLPGLERMLQALLAEFSALQGNTQIIPLPPKKHIDAAGNLTTNPLGNALHITKRPHASLRLFLGGHMDTVYSTDHPFQTTKRQGNILHGPGVADMKGGLIVMLIALLAFEQTPLAPKVGWEIVINPDEEIGSTGSEHLLIECAKRNHLALIFEPSFADGCLVGPRKGSANYTLIARGKAAHAGRDFEKGRNAITALSKLAIEAEKLSDPEKGISINVGHFNGGGPVNVVPDFALCRLNARAKTNEDFEALQHYLHNDLCHSLNIPDITFEVHEETARGPKIFDQNSQDLFAQFKACAIEDGFNLEYRPSGGVCDGNIFAAYGLPVLDTLGVIGGDLHSPNEYMLLDSLVSRSCLVLSFLLKLASGEYIPPTRKKL